MNTYSITAAILTTLTLVGVGCIQNPATNTNTVNINTTNASTTNTNATNTSTTASPETPVTVVDDAVVQDTTTTQPQQPGIYTIYDVGQVSHAANDGTAILYFHAPWCPTCSALQKDIEANLGDIPPGVTIFKTDYDTNVELRQQYGVTYQHTFVEVDAQGNMLDKWSGGNTLDTIIDHIN